MVEGTPKRIADFGAKCLKSFRTKRGKGARCGSTQSDVEVVSGQCKHEASAERLGFRIGPSAKQPNETPEATKPKKATKQVQCVEATHQSKTDQTKSSLQDRGRRRDNRESERVRGAAGSPFH
jgi:hypothetical protein